MVDIRVGGDQHLMPRPGLGGKLQRQLMGLYSSDVLLGRKGLDILVEIHPSGFVVGLLSSHKFREGVVAVTVDTSDQLPARDRVIYLLLSAAIGYEAVHSTGGLFGLRNIIHNRHYSLRAIRNSCS